MSKIHPSFYPFLTIALLITLVSSLSSCTKSPIIIMELPAGDLAWTNERPKGTKMCVPAAFTDKAGNIEGEYRLNGEIFYPNGKKKVSICKDIFYVDWKWHSDYGFHQWTLVYNNKAMEFRNPRKFVRRALCKKGEHVFLVQSRHRMTVTDFAKECARVSSDAVYLDTGIYGYGHIGNKTLFPWAFCWRHRQTNWLYIK